MEINNNSPYVKRPEETPLSQERMSNRPNRFASTAQLLGIIAIVSIFSFAVYPPLILGGLAITLAILSKGSETKMHSAARTGFVTGLLALILNVVLIGGAVLLLFTDNQYKTMLNEAFVEMYGQSFDAMIEDAMDGELDLEYNNLPGTAQYF